MQKVFFIGFVVMLSFGNFNCQAGGDKKFEAPLSQKQLLVMDNQLLNELASIEKQIPSNPLKSIDLLNKKVTYAIENNLTKSISKAYYLLGLAYKELQQAKVALSYFELYEQSLVSKTNISKTRHSKTEISKKSKSAVSKSGNLKGKNELEIANENETISQEIAEINNDPSSSSNKNTFNGSQPDSTNILLEDNISNTFSWSENKQNHPVNYFNELGEIYALLKNYEQSNTFFSNYKKQGISLALQKKTDYKIAQNLYELKQYDKAIVLYQSLLIYETERGNEEQISICHSRIAACYISKGDTEKGMDSYKKSVQGLTFNDSEQGSYSRSKLNSLSENKEVVTKALREKKLYKEELSVREEAIEVSSDSLEYLKLAQTYFQDNNFVQAEKSLDKFMKNISLKGLKQEDILVIKKLAQRLARQNKNQKALNYLLKYEELRDSISKVMENTLSKSQQYSSFGYEKAIELENLQKDKELSNTTIVHLMKEQSLKEEALNNQKTIIYLLSFLSLAGIITTIYILRVSKQRRIANQQLAIRSLRSQMNPHFIFNALNSVNSFISLNDERSANKFLSEFSALMRTVMENSEHDFISLSKELEILNLYIGLEHYRFKDKFQYTLNVENNIDEDEFKIPPMLVQPYIENAIWHGLRYKDENELGQLNVQFSQANENLKVEITDNGIGRKKSQAVKTKNQKKNKSTAIKNIDERIRLIAALHQIEISVSISDLYSDGTGTKISLIIPQVKNA